MSQISNLRRKLTESVNRRPKNIPTTHGNHNTVIGYPITFTLTKIRRRNARLTRRDKFRQAKRNSSL